MDNIDIDENNLVGLQQSKRVWSSKIRSTARASITLDPCIGYPDDPEEEYPRYDQSLDF